MTNVINQTVNVNAYYFTGRDMKTFPRQIELNGHVVTFASGLRYLVRRGSDAIKLFDMSATDGLTYRLRQETGNDWTLLATKGGF